MLVELMRGASSSIGPPRFRFGASFLHRPTRSGGHSVTPPGNDGGRFRRTLHVVSAAHAAKTWTAEKAATHKQYWDDVLQSVERPSAKRLLKFVDTSIPLGLGLPVSGRGRAKPRGDDGLPLPARPPSYSFFYETKLLHPVCIEARRATARSPLAPTDVLTLSCSLALT